MTTNVQEILKSKLLTMFPENDARQEIIKILNQYGTETYEKEIDRVQLDILKLAGTSIEAVRMWVDVAKRDYRDILAAAEYPNQLLAPTWKMAKDEITRIQASDRKQYEEWIKHN